MTPTPVYVSKLPLWTQGQELSQRDSARLSHVLDKFVAIEPKAPLDVLEDQLACNTVENNVATRWQERELVF
jgi:hypothetical protein